MPDEDRFVTILTVLDREVLPSSRSPEKGKASCINCSLNGGDTLTFSTRNVKPHTRHHAATGGEYSQFMIDANFAE